MKNPRLIVAPAVAIMEMISKYTLKKAFLGADVLKAFLLSMMIRMSNEIKIMAKRRGNIPSMFSDKNKMLM